MMLRRLTATEILVLVTTAVVLVALCLPAVKSGCRWRMATKPVEMQEDAKVALPEFLIEYVSGSGLPLPPYMEQPYRGGHEWPQSKP